MRKVFLFFLIGLVNNVYSQSKQFHELNNRLLFNLFTGKPDSSISDFVGKYYPELLANGVPDKWTIAPTAKKSDVNYKTEHVFLFKTHPFLNIKFDNGSLEFLSVEEENSLPRLQYTRLCLSFENKNEASLALNSFISLFENCGINKKTIVKDNKTIILISETKTIDWINTVELVLFKDELYDGKYKILYDLGCYTYPKEYYGY